MPSSGGSERYRVRDLVVDVTGASVSRGGERIVLPPRTFELPVYVGGERGFGYRLVAPVDSLGGLD